MPFFLTTAIPYVNAAPHIGFAMELVLADVVARFYRMRGVEVRLLTGSDENSLKNVQAAETEQVPVEELVKRNAQAFRDLQGPLNLSFDDFICTSSDPRHRAGVEKLWKACLDKGDIYRKPYQGLYCVGCEQFYSETELTNGVCPEHKTPLELVEEENYFFRLSKYAAELLGRLRSGELRVVPERYLNEILAFAEAGLQDFSISRSQRRARGWGIPVPNDVDQTMYVWFDALGNYITALDYASEGELFQSFWRNSAQRIHFIGKGITRFHALYWPAMLLSAGEALPTTISVHGYLTVEGQKIGKSLGNAIDPRAIVEQFGTDTVRYFLCRHIRTGQDGDFSLARVTTARDAELADQLGNLLHRTVAMVQRYYEGVVPEPSPTHMSAELTELGARACVRYDQAFEELRLDEALSAAWALVEWGNKYVVERAPWLLAKGRTNVDNEKLLATTLYELVRALHLTALLLSPFLPSTSAKIIEQLGAHASDDLMKAFGHDPAGDHVRLGEPLFPKPIRE